MIQKIKKQWFLFGLIFIVLAVVFDKSNSLVKIGLALKQNHGPEIMVFLIFIVSGFLIENDQIKAGIKDFKATCLTLIVIIVFAPVAAGLLCLFPLETGVIIGLFIVAAMPTTLSSGVVMTGAAGGNMAHALFVTLLSNFIGIFSIPVVLSILLSFFNYENGLDIARGSIMMKLLFLVLIPLMIGIVAKAIIARERFFDKFKLQIINQCMVIGVVFISIASAKQVLSGSGTTVLYILFLVTAFHLMLLGVSFLFVTVFNIKKGRCESVIFMGSQKTLPLSVMIQVTYFSEFGTALLVCVIHHIVHLVIDGYLSAKMGDNFFAEN